MGDSKVWYLSRSVWAMIVMIVAMILSFFKVDFGAADQAAVVDFILKLVEVGAGLFAIIFRLIAKKQLTLTK